MKRFIRRAHTALHKVEFHFYYNVIGWVAHSATMLCLLDKVISCTIVEVMFFILFPNVLWFEYFRKFDCFCETISFGFLMGGGFSYVVFFKFEINDYLACQLLFPGVEVTVNLFNYLLGKSLNKVFMSSLVGSWSTSVC